MRRVLGAAGGGRGVAGVRVQVVRVGVGVGVCVRVRLGRDGAQRAWLLQAGQAGAVSARERVASAGQEAGIAARVAAVLTGG